MSVCLKLSGNKQGQKESKDQENLEGQAQALSEFSCKVKGSDDEDQENKLEKANLVVFVTMMKHLKAQGSIHKFV